MRDFTKTVNTNAKDNREELKKGYMINGYEIVSIIGKGGSGITYNVRKSGENRVLKEIYPRHLSDTHYIARNEKKHIVVNNKKYLDTIKNDISERVLHEELCNKTAKYNVEAVSTSAKAFRCVVLEKPEDYSEDELFGYIVMDTIDGKTLSNLFKEEKRDIRRALVLTKAVLESVIELHGKGLLHLDLTPYNCYFQEATGDSLCVLLDFGSAMFIDILNTSKEIIYPSYSEGFSAPEIIMYAYYNNKIIESEQELEEKKALKNPEAIMIAEHKVVSFERRRRKVIDSIGICSDYYSVGAILFDLIVGESYNSKIHDISEKLSEKLENEYILIREELMELIHKSLCVESEERYEPSCNVENNEFLKAIDHVIRLIDGIRKHNSYTELSLDDDGAMIEENYSQLLFSCSHKEKDITEYIKEWDKLENISVICGGTGSGKTWFMKHFCMEISKNNYADYEILPKYVRSEVQAVNFINSIREYSNHVKLLVFIDKEISEATIDMLQELLSERTKVVYCETGESSNDKINVNQRFMVDKLSDDNIRDYLKKLYVLPEGFFITDSFAWRTPLDLHIFATVHSQNKMSTGVLKDSELMETYFEILLASSGSVHMLENVLASVAVGKAKETEVELCLKIKDMRKILSGVRDKQSGVLKVEFKHELFHKYFTAKYIAEEIMRRYDKPMDECVAYTYDEEILRFLGDILCKEDEKIWNKVLADSKCSEKSQFILNIIGAFCMSGATTSLKICDKDLRHIGGLSYYFLIEPLLQQISFERCIFDRTNFAYPNSYVVFSSDHGPQYRMLYNTMLDCDYKGEFYVQYNETTLLSKDGQKYNMQVIQFMDEVSAYYRSELWDKSKKMVLDCQYHHVLYECMDSGDIKLVFEENDKEKCYNCLSNKDDNKIYPVKIAASEDYVAVGYASEEAVKKLERRPFDYDRWSDIVYTKLIVYKKNENLSLAYMIDSEAIKAFDILQHDNKCYLGYISELKFKICDIESDAGVKEYENIMGSWVHKAWEKFVVSDECDHEIKLYSIGGNTISVDVGSRFFPSSIRTVDHTMYIHTLYGVLEYEYLHNREFIKKTEYIYNTDRKFDLWSKMLDLSAEKVKEVFTNNGRNKTDISMVDCQYRDNMSDEKELLDIELSIRNDIQREVFDIEKIMLCIFREDFYNAKYMAEMIVDDRFDKSSIRKCIVDKEYRIIPFCEILSRMTKDEIEEHLEWVLECSAYALSDQVKMLVAINANCRETDWDKRHNYPTKFSELPERIDKSKYVGQIIYLIAEQLYEKVSIKEQYYENIILKLLLCAYEKGGYLGLYTYNKYYRRKKKKNLSDKMIFKRKACLEKIYLNCRRAVLSADLLRNM